MYFIAFDTNQITDAAQGEGSSYYKYFAGALIEELVHVSRYHNDDMSTEEQWKQDNHRKIKEEAWQAHKEIFGVRSPMDPLYLAADANYAPTCLRNKDKP